MSVLKRKFGARLRSIREQRGFSQEAFAEMLGISVDFLSLIERGVNGPSFGTLELFAEKLQMPVKSFFDFED